jgi:polyhydroxyalkanoate synthesis regulator phasin
MTKSTIDRLTSLGEEVIGKASQNPTANRVLQSAMQMKERVDDLSKRVRGLEAMEKQIAELEKRVAKLEGAAKRAAPAKPNAGAERKTATKE